MEPRAFGLVVMKLQLEYPPWVRIVFATFPHGYQKKKKKKKKTDNGLLSKTTISNIFIHICLTTTSIFVHTK